MSSNWAITLQKQPKGESTVNHSKVTRHFKKFCSGYKNVDNQAMSGRVKTIDSKAMLLAIVANPESVRRTCHLTV